jgi:hypothetical protein
VAMLNPRKVRFGTHPSCKRRAFEPKFIELVTKGVNFICNLGYLGGGAGGRWFKVGIA